MAVAKLLFLGREYPLQKRWTLPFQDAAEAGDIDDVYAYSDYHPPSFSRGTGLSHVARDISVRTLILGYIDIVERFTPLLARMRESGFLRREVNGVVYYSCAALEQVPGVRHAFSTRHGGVSAFPVNSLNLAGVPWDHPDRVAENRRRFMSATGLGSARLATLAQIHSDRLHILTADGEEEETRAQGDALATSSKGIALAVQTADCLPLLVADPRNLAIAAIHSGWRGTVARICSKTIEGMRANFGSDPDRLIVAMGPGIRACCFEVGSEVVDQFAASFSGINLAKPCVGSPGKHLLDLPGAIDFQLRQAGVDPDNVFDVGICTRCRIDECFSYRGEGPRSGRMMAAIASVEFA